MSGLFGLSTSSLSNVSLQAVPPSVPPEATEGGYIPISPVFAFDSLNSGSDVGRAAAGHTSASGNGPRRFGERTPMTKGQVGLHVNYSSVGIDPAVAASPAFRSRRARPSSAQSVPRAPGAFPLSYNLMPTQEEEEHHGFAADSARASSPDLLPRARPAGLVHQELTASRVFAEESVIAPSTSPTPALLARSRIRPTTANPQSRVLGDKTNPWWSVRRAATDSTAAGSLNGKVRPATASASASSASASLATTAAATPSSASDSAEGASAAVSTGRYPFLLSSPGSIITSSPSPAQAPMASTTSVQSRVSGTLGESPVSEDVLFGLRASASPAAFQVSVKSAAAASAAERARSFLTMTDVRKVDDIPLYKQGFVPAFKFPSAVLSYPQSASQRPQRDAPAHTPGSHRPPSVAQLPARPRSSSASSKAPPFSSFGNSSFASMTPFKSTFSPSPRGDSVSTVQANRSASEHSSLLLHGYSPALSRPTSAGVPRHVPSAGGNTPCEMPRHEHVGEGEEDTPAFGTFSYLLPVFEHSHASPMSAMYVELAAANQLLEAFIRRCELEKSQFQSELVFYECKVEEVIQATAPRLPTGQPPIFRIFALSYLAKEISKRHPGPRKIVQGLFDLLHAAIFARPDSDDVVSAMRLMSKVEAHSKDIAQSQREAAEEEVGLNRRSSIRETMNAHGDGSQAKGTAATATASGNTKSSSNHPHNSSGRGHAPKRALADASGNDAPLDAEEVAALRLLSTTSVSRADVLGLSGDRDDVRESSSHASIRGDDLGGSRGSSSASGLSRESSAVLARLQALRRSTKNVFTGADYESQSVDLDEVDDLNDEEAADGNGGRHSAGRISTVDHVGRARAGPGLSASEIFDHVPDAGVASFLAATAANLPLSSSAAEAESVSSSTPQGEKGRGGEAGNVWDDKSASDTSLVLDGNTRRGLKPVVDGTPGSKAGFASSLLASAVKDVPVPYVLMYNVATNAVDATNNLHSNKSLRLVTAMVEREAAFLRTLRVRTAFFEWRSYTRRMRTLTRIGSIMTANDKQAFSPFLAFHLWRRSAERTRIKREFRQAVAEMHKQTRAILRSMSAKHAITTHTELSVTQMFADFRQLQRQSIQEHEPRDIFTDEFLVAVLSRIWTLIRLVEATDAPNLHQLASTYDAHVSPVDVVDRVSAELLHLGESHLEDLRERMLAKLQQRYADEEEAHALAVEELTSLPAEEILIRWINSHSTRPGSWAKAAKKVPTDLGDLLAYFSVLQSVHPTILEGRDPTLLEPSVRAELLLTLLNNMQIDHCFGAADEILVTRVPQSRSTFDDGEGIDPEYASEVRYIENGIVRTFIPTSITESRYDATNLVGGTEKSGSAGGGTSEHVAGPAGFTRELSGARAKVYNSSMLMADGQTSGGIADATSNSTFAASSGTSGNAAMQITAAQLKHYSLMSSMFLAMPHLPSTTLPVNAFLNTSTSASSSATAAGSPIPTPNPKGLGQPLHRNSATANGPVRMTSATRAGDVDHTALVRGRLPWLSAAYRTLSALEDDWLNVIRAIGPDEIEGSQYDSDDEGNSSASSQHRNVSPSLDAAGQGGKWGEGGGSSMSNRSKAVREQADGVENVRATKASVRLNGLGLTRPKETNGKHYISSLNVTINDRLNPDDPLTVLGSTTSNSGQHGRKGDREIPSVRVSSLTSSTGPGRYSHAFLTAIGAGGAQAPAGPNHCHTFLNKMNAFVLQCELMLHRARRHNALYVAIKNKVVSFLLTSLQRLRIQRDVTSGASLEAAALEDAARSSTGAGGLAELSSITPADMLSWPRYQDLQIARVMDLLGDAMRPQTEYNKIVAVLGKYRQTLMSIFKHYSTLSGQFTEAHVNSTGLAMSAAGKASGNSVEGSQLSFQSYLAFCIDCRLAAPASAALHAAASGSTSTSQASVAAGSDGQIEGTLLATALGIRRHGIGDGPSVASTVSANGNSGPIGLARFGSTGHVLADRTIVDVFNAVANEAESVRRLSAVVSSSQSPSTRSPSPLLSSSSSPPPLPSSAEFTRPSHSIGPRAFMESLIRLSSMKYSGLSSPADRVLRLILVDVLPNASRLHLSAFRLAMRRSACISVMAAHQRLLKAAFSVYADHKQVMISSPQGPVPGRTVSTIGLRGFTSMLADAGQLDHVVTEATVGSLYAKVLHFPDDGEQMTEMGFTEFCDAIGALAQTKIPDPYLPLDRKLDAFLTGSFELGIRPILRDAGLR